MQESLNGVVVKKRKKQKLAEEITNFNSGEADAFGNQCALNTEVLMLPIAEAIEPDSSLLVTQGEEGTASNKRGGGRRKKGCRVRKGFYLNPKFFYSTEGDIHLQIRSSVYDCVERLIPDTSIQDKIVKETTSYRGAAGDFGRKIAIRGRETLLPEREIQTDDIGRSDWMTVDPPLGNIMVLGPQVDDIEALGEGFDDHEIFDGLKDGEDENGENNVQQVVFT
ncbi:hypothetical protein Ccrd_011753 [Cynara cardunculus var. scolymus]|uniref:Uncharacterized protein n=1 Tax=Cynara cardunculus var. scolymus TaxID=59895 RepID=A0A103YIY4_CYNCS|nr:hypothetical protein Ccrd_011753 [Cynara cardunculus var. scolymus]